MTGSPSSDSLARAVRAVVAGDALDESLTAEAFGQVMRGEGSPALVAALLVGLRVRGERAAEIAGAVRALREAMVPVAVTRRDRLVDTCGTGGGTVGTFNVSTAAALVAAGAGAVVAKHGNRSFTSKSGSADVLEALGVPIALDAASASSLLDEAGIAFLFAPNFHPAMRHVGPIRRELGVPTIMNLVGPLANPAGVTRQLVGVADVRAAPLMAEALHRLGAEHALVVHAQVGMDEIAPCGETLAWEVTGDGVRHFVIDPEAFGLVSEDLGALGGREPASNARRIERLLQDPAHDAPGRAVVSLNAGAACLVAGLVDTLGEGVARAVESLESGAAAAAQERLRQGGAAFSTSE